MIEAYKPSKPTPILALLAISLVYVGVLGFFWLQVPPSNQELLANYAKVADYAAAVASVHGTPWWTPNYLQGSSLAFSFLGALTNLILFTSALVVGPWAGVKLAAIAFLFLCPLTMFAFIRRLCPHSGWTAFSCGAAYLFAPAILLRLGHVEHVGNVLAFAMIPLAFRSVLVLFEDRNARSAILCAAANSLLVLAYAKIAVLVLPLLTAFALWAWIARAHFTSPPKQCVLLCFGIFLILGALPNLPSLRESRLVAKFDFGPFAGWQRNYSAESVLSWMDRESLLTGAPGSPQSEVRTSLSYLGIAGLACVTGLFFLRRREAWQSSQAAVFRLFVALTLLAHWLGLGVNTALSGQFAFLSHADSAWDPAIAISWGLLALQGVAIALIMPGSLPARPWLVTIAILVYFCVPGFRSIELLPLYADIRAPHDFFEMGGVFCFSVAAGLAADLLIREICHRGSRWLVAGALLGLASADSGSAVPSLFKGPMDRQTFDDFLAAQTFLKNAARTGRIAPYSGRYFYLLTPILSGRGLITEAFNGHLMLRGVAELQRASFLSQEHFSTFLNIAGVSHILIDKKDPDTPGSFQQTLRSLAPAVFENEHFVVLENSDALYPAAFAKNFLAIQEPAENVARLSLESAARGLLAVSQRTKFGDNEGLVASNDGLASSNLMQTMPFEAIERKSNEEIRVKPHEGVGWLVIPEAFHPDWKAVQAGRLLEIARAYGALLTIRLDGMGGLITLAFHPPWWYFACVWASLAGWLVVIAFLGTEKLSLLPEDWRAFLLQAPAPPQALALNSSDLRKAPSGKVLVIIPTYNEAFGIGSILDKTLVADRSLEILVVDDSSPDQTANVVQSHAAFNSRVHLVKREGKLGLGSAYKEGFRWAIARGFGACIQIDADLSHDPADIPRLIEALENGADAAIGSRYAGGVRVMNWPQDRLFLSLGASRFVRALTGLPLTDVTSGFKAIRCAALRGLDWNRFTTEGYGFQVELHYFLWKSGAKLVEVPIVFTERRSGETKMTLGIAAEAVWRVFQLVIFKK
ncbi:MAG TPA: glycosyltransferase [Terrimicrobiaceae bacterium]